jgi:hypothetical protein
VSVTIGNPAYTYDTGVTLGTSGGLTPTLVTPDTNGFGGVQSDTVVFTYTGFSTGGSHAFEADIDLDGTTSGGPDFRGILFNNGAAPNAAMTVTFQGGGTLTATLPDAGFQAVYTVTAP